MNGDVKGTLIFDLVGLEMSKSRSFRFRRLISQERVDLGRMKILTLIGKHMWRVQRRLHI